MSHDEATTPIGDLDSRVLPTEQKTTAAPAPRAAFAPGAVIAKRYRIVALLGRGGMGAVYRADDLRLGQPVALKFVAVEGARAAEYLAHEVRVARQVSHPNVCRVHDIVEADGLHFIAMEYVDGEDLASLLRRIGRLPAAKAVAIARDIASGVAAAHDQGIIHRDLKPANVMIDGGGRARITDFGLASAIAAGVSAIAGTPAYMAPEQVAGESLDERTDVYALGLILYEIFSGERVYGTSSYSDRKQQRARTPPRLGTVVRDVEPHVEEVITGCLAPDPAMRPASARAVLAALPGGDALDAALAAGETPSPEMIAAAAATGEVTPAIALLALGITAAGLLLTSWQSGSRLYSLVRKPPEVLAERAEEIATRAGETAVVRDAAHTFTYDEALLDRPDPTQWRPGLAQFTMHRSPSRLVPREMTMPGNGVFIFQSGRITRNDPRPQRPGEATITVDQHGALVEYVARPSGKGAIDWKPLLESAGVDLATLVPAAPLATPPNATDARLAWTAAFPGERERARIEAASLNGRPAWLRVYPPRARLDERSAPLIAGTWIGMLQLTLMLVFTVAAIVSATHNLRRGRGDRRGALRFALYIGLVLLVSWLIAAHHAADPLNEARLFAGGAGEAAATGLIIWIFYLALEPGVRREWPRALIGWTRLLAGRLRDPMVGREILFGIAAGLAVRELMHGIAWIQDHVGAATITYNRTSSLQPLAVFIGDHLIGHVEAIEITIGTMFMLLLFRRVAGAALGGTLFALLNFAYMAADISIPVYIALLVFVLFRFGILTAVTLGCTFTLLLHSPLTLDTSIWYWPRAAVVLLLVIAAAVWSARVAVGARPLVTLRPRAL